MHFKGASRACLLHQANHADGNGLTLTLRVFRASFFCLLFRFEWLRQRREFTCDEFEEQPLLG